MNIINFKLSNRVDNQFCFKIISKFWINLINVYLLRRIGKYFTLEKFLFCVGVVLFVAYKTNAYLHTMCFFFN